MSVYAVKSWMRFLGWTNEGAPGAVKKTCDGAVIGKHGDAVWNADVDHAIKQIERERESARAST